MRIILALVLGLAGGLALAQAATTNATTFAVTRDHCDVTNNGDTKCTLNYVSNTNGSRLTHVLTMPVGGGPITDETGHQTAANVPAGISSTCGACAAAVDTVITANGGALTP